MEHLLDPTGGDLKAWMAERGQPPYRAAQVRRWLFERRAADWGGMSDLPKPLRTELSESYQFWTTEVAKHSRPNRCWSSAAGRSAWNSRRSITRSGRR
jgi:adenine C2-methylase RlmN of 23S rRNA A2503 and tRNA A37